jgi:uncharacterized protein with NAD-binding domain and iron-sulfur cluster
VRRDVLEWLRANIHLLWPNFADEAGNIDWNQLVDLNGGTGEARFDAQFRRGNIAPTERYVQSVPGSAEARLPADGSGFGNLYLAGDWVRTGINAGCVEAAVMGGFGASKALCGYPKKIIGETDF